MGRPSKAFKIQQLTILIKLFIDIVRETVNVNWFNIYSFLHKIQKNICRDLSNVILIECPGSASITHSQFKESL